MTASGRRGATKCSQKASLCSKRQRRASRRGGCRLRRGSAVRPGLEGSRGGPCACRGIRAAAGIFRPRRGAARRPARAGRGPPAIAAASGLPCVDCRDSSDGAQSGRPAPTFRSPGMRRYAAAGASRSRAGRRGPAPLPAVTLQAPRPCRRPHPTRRRRRAAVALRDSQPQTRTATYAAKR